MTEKDNEIVDRKLEKAISQQSELFDTRLAGIEKMIEFNHELNIEKLTTIDRKVTITNGTVAEQASKIEAMKVAEAKHYIECPNVTEIKELKKAVTTIEMMEAGRAAVQKFTWRQVTLIGIIGGVVLKVLDLVITSL